MATKKKELLGNFYRYGKLYTTAPITMNDHDFKSFAKGVVIPHGLYDVQLNKAMINNGSSCDTGEFVCDNGDIPKENWIRNADSILLLGDGGGSNGCNQYLFKQDLQSLVDEIGVDIRVAHYAAYCSQYKPDRTSPFPPCYPCLLRRGVRQYRPRHEVDQAY
jgi:hypothetical protein